GQESLHDIRIEPASAALLRHFNCSSLSASRVKHVDCLRQIQDSRKHRDFRPAKTHRLPSPVPQFVKTPNRDGGGFRESDAAGDVRAALTADLNHFLRVLLLAYGQGKEGAHALEERRSRFYMRKGVVDRFPAELGPVGSFHVALGLNVIRTEQMI